jgi:hypothetical protein
MKIIGQDPSGIKLVDGIKDILLFTTHYFTKTSVGNDILMNQFRPNEESLPLFLSFGMLLMFS